MKVEYEQKFSTGIPGEPMLKIVETNESKQYFYGKEVVDEQRYQEILKTMKSNGSLGEYKNIIALDDVGKQISKVALVNNDIKTSLEASVNDGNGNFNYEQIKQKNSKLSIRGKLASSYLSIEFGDKKSEYIDQQPRLDDPLLDKRDEILNPYMNLMSGNLSIAEFVKLKGTVVKEQNDKDMSNELSAEMNCESKQQGNDGITM